MKIYKIFGWNDIINLPSEQYVGIFGHSSYFDIFILLIYKLSGKFNNITTLVTPQLKKYEFLCRYFNLIVAPPNENKNSNTIDVICEKLNNSSLLISPKGTIKNKPWRTGYYYIAKNKNIKIYPLIINYSSKTIQFGNPVNPQKESVEECHNKLIEQIQTKRIINMENAEYNITSSECPYETIFHIDLALITQLLYLPYLYNLISNPFIFFSYSIIYLYNWYNLVNNKYNYKLLALYAIIKIIIFNKLHNFTTYWFLLFYLFFANKHNNKHRIFNAIANIIMLLALQSI